MMKWFILVVFCAGLFIAGALYGMDKNSKKYENLQASVATVNQGANDKSGDMCEPPKEKDKIPVSVKVATGIGEGVTTTFEMVVLLVSDVINPPSS